MSIRLLKDIQLYNSWIEWLMAKGGKSLENIADLWDKVLINIEKKVSKPSFDTWLKITKAHMLQGDTLIVTAPNEFARDWLEGRYSQLISGLFMRLSVKILV